MLSMSNDNDKRKSPVVAKHFYRDPRRQEARIARLTREYQRMTKSQRCVQREKYAAMAPITTDDTLTVQAHLDAIDRCT